jgi:malonate decarboxylase beta subunit
MNLSEWRRRDSFYEASARRRILGVLDKNSFQELLGPTERITSPHLEQLGFPVSFDDGVVIGSGLLDGKRVLIAAQESGFMGGSVGEVHGAKITGLLQLALMSNVTSVLLLLDTGGVRLHEANAGLVAISEILRAAFRLREAGIPILVLIGGNNGCFGGTGIFARCCDYVIMSEEGRLSVAGPEVIETAGGVEEFDSRDRALVWRTMGGKHRFLLGEADLLVVDDIKAFRAAAIELMQKPKPLTLEIILKEHQRLCERLVAYGECNDALDIWQKMGIPEFSTIPLMDNDEFHAIVKPYLVSQETYHEH